MSEHGDSVAGSGMASDDKPVFVGPAPADHVNRATDPELVAKIRAKGWGVPVEYDYKSLNIANRNERRFFADATRYEWKDEYGDVGPAIPELEEQLFRSDFINRPGEMFER